MPALTDRAARKVLAGLRSPDKSAVADSCIAKQASRQRDTCSFWARIEKRLQRLWGGDRRLTGEIAT